MNRAGELRRAFDASFALAPDAAAADHVDLLAIRLGGAPFALALAELASLHADQAITRLPSRAGALLGLTGIRGAIVPVFDLAQLLGAGTSSAPRWLAVAAQGRIGLAFERLDAYLRAPRAAIAAATSDAKTPEVLDDRGLLRPIVRLASVLAALEPKET